MTNFDRNEAVKTARKEFETAEDEAVIIAACARLIWYFEHDTECPKEEIPTVEEFFVWFRENHAQKISGTLPGFEFGRSTYDAWIKAQAEYPLHAFGSNLYLHDLTEWNRRELKAGRIPPTVRLRPGEKPEDALIDFSTYLPIDALRNQWQQAREAGLWPEGKANPIRKMVEAWQNRPTRIEPFVPRQKAQLTFFDRIKDTEAKRLITAQKELPFPELQRVDEVSSWLLNLYDRVGGSANKQGRGAPWPMRLFIGGLLHVPIDKRDGEGHYFSLPTDEVIRWLFPDSKWTSKYSRWNSFTEALKEVNRLGWISVPDVGSVHVFGVSVIPEKHSDPYVQFITRVPPSAAHGARIDWPKLCEYGKKSAPLYRAYLTACEFMHRSAHNGHAVTEVIGKALLKPDGTPVRKKGKKGEKPKIVRSTTEFEPNPAAHYVTGLTKVELTAAIGLDASNRANCKVAFAAFEQLADDGIIDLQKKGSGQYQKFFLFAPNQWASAHAEVLKKEQAEQAEQDVENNTTAYGK